MLVPARARSLLCSLALEVLVLTFELVLVFMLTFARARSRLRAHSVFEHIIAHVHSILYSSHSRLIVCVLTMLMFIIVLVLGLALVFTLSQVFIPLCTHSIWVLRDC